MLSPWIYPWFSAYRAAVLEPDFALVPERVREALSSIHDRLNGPAQMDEPGHPFTNRLFVELLQTGTSINDGLSVIDELPSG
jgi:hypothetical protein